MKTASINVYEIFGTKGRLCACIYYRGKLLKSFTQADFLVYETPQYRGLMDLSKAWILANGFTHYKLSGALN